MAERPAKRGNLGIKIMGVFVAIGFTALTVYLTAPVDIIGYASAGGFGILLTLGLVVLTVLDGRARSRGVRFFVDWVVGTILLLLVQLVMIGLQVEWLFIAAGSGIIAFISLIVALRTRYVTATPTSDTDGMHRRRRA